MTPFPQTYNVYLTGQPSGRGELMTSGVRPLATAAPREFDGPGDAWSPEALLLAAVNGCFLFTLQAVARHSRFEFVDVAISADGIVDRGGGSTRFTEIILRVTLTVPAGADVARAHQVLEKTERACLVSASIATPIRLETEIVESRLARRRAG